VVVRLSRPMSRTGSQAYPLFLGDIRGYNTVVVFAGYAKRLYTLSKSVGVLPLKSTDS